MRKRKHTRMPKAYQEGNYDPLQPLRPTRKIRPTACSVTGRIFSQKVTRFVEFESHLEKRFVLQLEADPQVESYCEQPVSIEYKDESGKTRVYTPDFLVKFKQVVGQAPPDLVEIKYLNDLVKNWEELAPKLAAGADYAAANGMRFRVVTEKDLPMEEHHAVMALKTHVRCDQRSAYEPQLLHALSAMRVSTPSVLLGIVATEKNEAPVVLRAIWGLVIAGKIQADLSSLPHLYTQLWLPSQKGATYGQE